MANPTANVIGNSIDDPGVTTSVNARLTAARAGIIVRETTGGSQVTVTAAGFSGQYNNNYFKDCYMRFLGNVTPALAGVTVRITNYDKATGVFTVDSIGTNHAADDIAVISDVMGVRQRTEDVYQLLLGTGQLQFSSDGPVTLQVDDIGYFQVSLMDIDTGAVPSANITAGTYTVDRSRAGGAFTNIVPSTASTKADGKVSVTYTVGSANWDEGDIGRVTMTGIQATIDAKTYNVPDMVFLFRISQEVDIETKVDDIRDAVNPAGAGSDAQTARSVVDLHKSRKGTGDIYFVSPAGDDGNPGSYDQPFEDPDYAVGQCTPNNDDVIILLPGAYDVKANIGGLLADVVGITILGCNTAKNQQRTTIVNSNGSAVNVINVGADNVTIANLAIIETTTGVTGIAIPNGSDGAHIHDVLCDGTMAIGIAPGGAEGIIENCQCIGMTNDGIQVTGDRNTVRNCTIIAPGDNGIKLTTDADYNLVMRNTIIGAGITTTGILINANCEHNMIGPKNTVIGCTTPWTNNGGATNIFAGNNIGSQITAGNSVEEDIDAVYDRIGAPVGASISADIAALKGGILAGTAEAGSGTTTIVCSELAGFGDEYFKTKYYAAVMRNADVPGNPPEFQFRLVTDYVSATGTFTTTAFPAAVETGDEILFFHRALLNMRPYGTDFAPVSGTLSDIIHKNASYTFDNTKDSLEAISDKVGDPSARSNFPSLETMIGIPDAANSNLDDIVRTGYDSSAITSNEDGGIIEILRYLIANSPGKALTKTVTFSNTTGTVNLLTVTGDVEVEITAIIDTNCASAGGCNAEVGIAGNTDAILPATDITTMAAGEIWFNSTVDSKVEATDSARRKYTIGGGSDVIMTLSAQADSGVIDFYVKWRPLSSDGNVVAA